MPCNYVFEILVPCQFNTGKPVRTKHHKEWDKKILSISGGLTVLKPASGQWVDEDGRLYRDRVIPVRIMTTEKDMDEIIQMTMEHYRQRAIMSYCVSDAVKVTFASAEAIRKIDNIEGGYNGADKY